jgi:fructose transport system permease protein
MSGIASPSLDAAEEFLHRSTLSTRVHSILRRYPAISPALVLLLAVIVFGQVNPRFYLASNLSLIAQQVAVVGSLAIGQTLIIITAGIDLSLGAVMVYTSVIMARTVVTFGLPGPAALILGLAIGTAAGALNGLLITRLKLPPFIITLGTFQIFGALTQLMSNGETVQEHSIPDLLLSTGRPIQIGDVRITTGVILMAVMYVVVTWILRNTAWGRHVYAVGDDIEAARLAGIPVTRVLVSVYMFAGLIFGITAWILIGRVGAASPNAGTDANLDSITAVVIGGTSLFGGRGLVVGSLIGALIVGVFRNGLALAGVDVLWQSFTVGVLIIIAAAIDQWIRGSKQ